MTTEWLPIPNHKGYEITREGRVRDSDGYELQHFEDLDYEDAVVLFRSGFSVNPDDADLVKVKQLIEETFLVIQW